MPDAHEEVTYEATLAEASRASTRDDALVALARATAMLNAQLVAGAPAGSTGTETAFAHALGAGGVDDRLRDYLASVRELAERWQPYSYQITLGLPLGVSVGFTWQVHPPEALADEAPCR
jgi:hypothetical protein